MNFEKILILDDELAGRKLLESYLRSQQFSVFTAGTLAEADRLMKQEFFDLLLVDLDLPDGNGCTLIEQTARMEFPPVCIVLSGKNSGDAVIRALRAGAFDYLPKPYALEGFKMALERAGAFRHAQQVRRYLSEEGRCDREMIGDSPGMRHLRLLVGRVGATDSPVLISGERGTGRSHIAGMVHRASARASKPLVRMHCAGAEEARLENALFGRITEACEEGIGRSILQGGRLELAQGGTLLLEEISEMPMCLQIKLLNALREGEWTHPGSERRRQLDIRLFATTRRDLAGCVARGTFLLDLHKHLCGPVLYVPPLRERIADLPLLVFDWLERLPGDGKPAGISDEALRHLMAYSWPGNLRELENVLERAMILGEEGARLEAESFEWLKNRRPGGKDAGEMGAKSFSEPRFTAEAQTEPLLTLEELEKRQVLRALEVTNQNRTRAASLLKISVRTLRNKLHQYRAEDPSLVLTLARHRHLPTISSVAKSDPAIGLRT
ncbi:MAG: sigma-54 dependent transcriptional regulator [Verrucomicrobia bacterium]|nr:sigma-54 dependent transcriptional regulator [Verrucomicrobiota bacterium]